MLMLGMCVDVKIIPGKCVAYRGCARALFVGMSDEGQMFVHVPKELHTCDTWIILRYCTLYTATNAVFLGSDLHIAVMRLNVFMCVYTCSCFACKREKTTV